MRRLASHTCRAHVLAVSVLALACVAPAGAPQPRRPPAAVPVVAADDADVPSGDATAVLDAEELLSRDPTTIEEPAALVALALEASESSRQLWERGDIELALAMLDQAYALLLEIPDDDADFVQEKQDLRHLISRSVVEIYRSQLTSAADLGSAIQIDMNEHVEREIKSFQGRERDFFIEAYRRSGMYRPMIIEKLREAGVPEELSWLPLVESGFKTRALSSARALGMWQFIPSTGYRYGLSRSEWIDERMDPDKSTVAAIAYLIELHGMFGDWVTALAAYNCGENRVMRLIRSQPQEHLDHFWDLFDKLPRETARYVPRFFATLLIVRDPAAYGFELPEPDSPLDVEVVSVDRPVELAALERSLGLEARALASLNAELRRGVTPSEAYNLRVPAAVAAVVPDKLTAVSEYVAVEPADAFVVHRVRRGETLSTIARRYGTTVSAIARSNNLRSRNTIRVGQRLRVAVRGDSSAATRVVASAGPAGPVTHRIRPGDSLWRLASRYGTTVDRIRRDNGIRGSRLYVGRTLRILPGSAGDTRTYAVRRGDNLSAIAATHGVSLTSILRANGLSLRSTIHPGRVLIIPAGR
jgi:membrane-bound lytic murein transglycosylase D